MCSPATQKNIYTAVNLRSPGPTTVETPDSQGAGEGTCLWTQYINSYLADTHSTAPIHARRTRIPNRHDPLFAQSRFHFGESPHLRVECV